MQTGILYLIPTPLADQQIDQALAPAVQATVSELRHFIAENAKSARAFLKATGTVLPIQEIQISELNEHTKDSDLQSLLVPLLAGESCGLVSETGMPCLADPGAKVVQLAHQQGIKVVPLSGPSSIVSAIVSSGLNGQNFAFNGYLPAKSPDREEKIRALEQISLKQQQAQFFIETPYRAEHLFEALLRVCKGQTKISVAVDLGSENSKTLCKAVKDWKADPIVLVDKLVVFGLQSQ